ncbi:hypothetical protein BH11BAC3_BH11BAC3_11180 [soil metagenome]
MKIVLKLLALYAFLLCTVCCAAQNKIQKWDMFELTLHGPSAGNPFMGTSFTGHFTNADKVYDQEGYYDGNGIYVIRFMPDKEGVWNYVTSSNKAELNNKKGSFECTAPGANNHGLVRVSNIYHFKYDDGIPVVT